MGKTVRLNNFILWCKGWYCPIDTEMDMFTQVKQILKLDEYEFVSTNSQVVGILLNFIDDLKDDSTISGKSELRMLQWNSNVQKYMNWMDNDFELAVLMTIKDFFAFSISRQEIVLTPPVYSRKLYKMGFIAPSHFGNSYKLCNYKAKKFFKV